ncbi:unnamed protein product [Hymenolepis diminuta]|uniref:Uncharacterized protein n=1 Tax=Hymenolepis diminuta TaxID=6216 RepID=A0A0R3SFB5_HYMDI|nr:unnamed protein product [Hymenolepis diminuta]VUZ52015.1 unnamed protein product [Hymenolepis diminuta]
MLIRRSLILICLISLLLCASDQFHNEYDHNGRIGEEFDFHEEKYHGENFAEDEEEEIGHEKFFDGMNEEEEDRFKFEEFFGKQGGEHYGQPHEKFQFGNPVNFYEM